MYCSLILASEKIEKSQNEKNEKIESEDEKIEGETTNPREPRRLRKSTTLIVENENVKKNRIAG